MSGFFASSALLKEKPDEGGIFPKCGACGLYRRCSSPKIPLQGQGARSLLLVIDSPDRDDDEAGAFLSGEAGAFLKQSLVEVGIHPQRDAWVTGALICYPKKGIENSQIGYCHPNLRGILREEDPRVVITFGRSAFASMVKGKWSDIGTLERWLGWDIPLGGRWLVPTYHPATLLKMGNRLMDRLFLQHLEKAVSRLSDPRPSLVDYESKVEILFEEAEVLSSLKSIDKKGGFCAVDFETNCLKPEYRGARAVSFSVSNGERTISYPWTKKTASYTGAFLKSGRTAKIASNLKMEERWTRFLFGHGVKRWGWDTMLAAHVLDNRQGICSLKFQAFVKLGQPSYNDHIEPFLDSGSRHLNRIEEIDINQLLLYGGMDSLLEYELAMVQRRELGYED